MFSWLRWPFGLAVPVFIVRTGSGAALALRICVGASSGKWGQSLGMQKRKNTFQLTTQSPATASSGRGPASAARAGSPRRSARPPGCPACLAQPRSHSEARVVALQTRPHAFPDSVWGIKNCLRKSEKPICVVYWHYTLSWHLRWQVHCFSRRHLLQTMDAGLRGLGGPHTWPAR